MFENLTMQVAWRTPLDKLDALEKCVNEWIQTEENRWFEPSTSLTFQTIDYQRHLVITMGKFFSLSFANDADLLI